MLSDVAKHYLLPSIDAGILMEGKDGNLTSQLTEFFQFAPDLPCAFCCGRIDAGKLAEELMSPEDRIDALQPPKMLADAVRLPTSIGKAALHNFTLLAT